MVEFLLDVFSYVYDALRSTLYGRDDLSTEMKNDGVKVALIVAVGATLVAGFLLLI